MLEEMLLKFSPDLFVERSTQSLIADMDQQGFRGAVFGASGGIDSLVTAALCLRAKEKRDKWQVVAFQINDSRVKGEHYNTEIYRSLGAHLIQNDITTQVIHMEKRLGMPPRWLTMWLMKLVLRWVPTKAKRRLILAVMNDAAPGWMRIHYQLLTLVHHLRIARLKEYANRHKLLLLICSNLTETSLGYFVEQGVDDPQMGDCAPLSSVYKSQVLRVARFLGLPEHIIHQRPSPGFGGIYDEEIIGPYELVDLVLLGFQLGCSDAEISKAIWPHARKWRKRVPFSKKSTHDMQYVRFLRQLVKLSAQKAGPVE